MFTDTVTSSDMMQTNVEHTKRQHPRRSEDRCVTIINGQMHPVEKLECGRHADHGR